MSPIAAIDCGTNSIRLLIAQPGADGTLVDLEREMRINRLGEGVDATGLLSAEGIERTRVALHEYAEMMCSHGVSRVRMVATSATRDASNRDDFFAMTARELGAVIPGAVAEVITGDQEAHLSFTGAVGQFAPADGPFLVTDLGGGSTELVIGEEGAVSADYSAQIGCVRLTERALPSDPPTAQEVSAASAIAREALAPAFAAVRIEDARMWVGVAGTMTTLSAIGQKLVAYDPERINRSRVSFERLREVCNELIAMPRAERAKLGPMHPGRVDVIGGGSIVTLALIDEIERRSPIRELVVSEYDILDGIALSIAD